MPACLSVRPVLTHGTNRLPLDGFLVKYDVLSFFENLPRKMKVSLNSLKNNLYFTRRRVYIYGNISLKIS